jgi:hypothetical protein
MYSPLLEFALEIIADNFSKAGWSLGVCQPWIATSEQSGLLTGIAATENFSCASG